MRARAREIIIALSLPLRRSSISKDTHYFREDMFWQMRCAAANRQRADLHARRLYEYVLSSLCTRACCLRVSVYAWARWDINSNARRRPSRRAHVFRIVPTRSSQKLFFFFCSRSLHFSFFHTRLMQKARRAALEVKTRIITYISVTIGYFERYIVKKKALKAIFVLCFFFFKEIVYKTFL